MAKKNNQKEEGIEFLENPEILASKTEEFFNDKKNQTYVFGIGGVLLALVAVFFAYKYYITNQNKEAQEEMFQAVFYFEADSLGKALNGDGINYGFLDIISDYSGTDAANLASFYAGATYMQLGDFSSAVRYLEDFSGDDYLVQARAYALVGDANMELGDFAAAAKAYDKAASYNSNKQFSPIYLQKKGIALENDGKYAEAAKAFGTIIEKFAGSSLEQEAKKQKARLEGLAAQ
ncbi:MAG: tetratricopeptide repeat protein [Cyclobacteriaceae bacterium]